MIDDESCGHSSLHSNCHDQVAYAKFNLQINYPSQYFREVWHYKDVNSEIIRKAINEFYWLKPFFNKNINEKADTFSKTNLNILSSFISHETVLCND